MGGRFSMRMGGKWRWDLVSLLITSKYKIKENTKPKVKPKMKPKVTVVFI